MRRRTHAADGRRVLIGHLGLALGARAVRPRVPLGWLVVASYLPDLVKLTALPVMSLPRAETLSHSLPSVAVLAALVAAAWLARGRWYGASAGAASLLAGLCLLHWVLDLPTGCKPVLPGGPVLGLLWYVQPALDLPLEVGVLFAGWLAARRAGAVGGWWRTRTLLAVAAGAQVLFLGAVAYNSIFLVGRRSYVWLPATALAPRLVGTESPPPTCFELW